MDKAFFLVAEWELIFPPLAASFVRVTPNSPFT